MRKPKKECTMLDAFIENLQSALTDWFGYPWIAVVILAMMPIVEARLAVPMAMACGYKAWQSFFIGFLGSSLPAPLLLLVLIPFIKWLAKTKLFRKLGETVYEKFQKKSETVDKNSSDFKKMLGLFVFVAIPLPLTGVWTGCAVASIIGLKYHKALLSVVAGNAVACAILSVLCYFLPQSVINIIIAAVAAIAVVVVLVLLFKAFFRKKSAPADDAENNQEGSTEQKR